MRPTPSILWKYMDPRLVHFKYTGVPLSSYFKYQRVPKFRHKISTRTGILKSILPTEYQLSEDLLFICTYFKTDISLVRIPALDKKLVRVDQERILELGENLLNMRLYNVMLNNKDGVSPIDILSQMDPRQLNSEKMRNDFINQFNQRFDSKDLLKKISYANFSRTMKIEKSSREKLLHMLTGLIHCQLGADKSQKFVDDWIIRGRWSGIESYKHKGLLELYTDRKTKNMFDT